VTIDPQKAVDFIRDSALPLAQAKANRVYCEEYRKTLKAKLMKGCGLDAIGAQEREAYAHPDYAAHLEALREAVAEEEKLRWQMVAAQARVEVWRSQESSARAEGRAVR
jgi:hypothetical protein